MSTPVTVQAFREAAAFELEMALVEASDAEADVHHCSARLYLAAAEQGEQLARYKQLALDQDKALAALPEENARLREHNAAMHQLNESDNRTQAAYHEQIATLTAELSDARTALAQAVEQLAEARLAADTALNTVREMHRLRMEHVTLVNWLEVRVQERDDALKALEQAREQIEILQDNERERRECEQSSVRLY